MLPNSYQRNVCRGLLASILLSVLALSSNAQGDGIAVGKPKVFDNRALTIMLEQLNQSLAQVQVVDQKSLAESLGLFQGSQTQEVSRSLSVSTLPLPGIKTTEQANSAGQLVPNQQTTDRAAINPSPPTLPDILATPNFQPKYGSSANDLLSDQINLSYQIFNLRMLLERSLSDRLWQDPTDSSRIGQRLQAVIGFDVTLDPPREAANCAAVVEITIAAKDPKIKFRPSLVAMMPQEKTYNSAALNSHSNAFGGSAVAKIVTIGYSERHRGQTFYVFRDTDTVSVERMGNPIGIPPNVRATTFGWEFRPVLGRKSVSPGARQVFAVLALPDFDQYLATPSGAPPTTAPPSKEDKSLSWVCREQPDGTTVCTWETIGFQTSRKNPSPPFEILVWSRVYWRKYDSKTLTTSMKKKELASPPRALCDADNPCAVPYTATIQGSLQPRIRDAKWFATDDKNVAITIVGDNFFSGTSVYLGGAVLDSEKAGLLIKSDQDLTLRTTLAAVASGNAVLNGRYGGSVPVETTLPGAAAGGVEINSIRVNRFPGRTTADLFVLLQGRGGRELKIEDFKGVCNPVVQVGSVPLPPPYYYRQIPYEGSSGKVRCDMPLKAGQKCVELQAPIAVDLISKDLQVKFKCPFRGSLFEDSYVTYDPSIVKATILGTHDKTTALAIAGDQFDDRWTIQLDQPYVITKGPPSLGKLVLEGSTLLVLEVSSDTLKGYKNLVLVPPNGGQPIEVPIPEASATPTSPEPKLACTQPITIEQYSSRSVLCWGESLSGITAATFENVGLTIKLITDKNECTALAGPTSDKTGCFRVFLTRRVTRKPGRIEVLLHTKDDKFVVPLKVVVQPAATKPAP